MAKEVVKILSVAQASKLSGGAVGINRLRDIAKEPNCEFSIKKGKHTTLIREREFIDWLKTTKNI